MNRKRRESQSTSPVKLSAEPSEIRVSGRSANTFNKYSQRVFICVRNTIINNHIVSIALRKLFLAKHNRNRPLYLSKTKIITGLTSDLHHLAIKFTHVILRISRMVRG